MPKKNLIYEAIKDGEPVIRDTAIELADYFHVAFSTIGNCERTGRRLKKGYLIERVGWEDWKDDVEIDDRIRKDLAKGISRKAIAERLGMKKDTVNTRIARMKKRGEL